MGGLSDADLEALEARNLERCNALTARGASLSAGNAATDRYQILLLEALVGPGVARRCREDAAEWLTDALDGAEEAVAEHYRKAMLLGGNGATP